MTKAPRYSIILAAGKGTRMQSATCHKVCFPVDGVPAINRAIAIYNDCGITRHIVVVGSLAGQVVETVGKAFTNVQFAYQAEQSGTADGARIGLRALEGVEGDPDILLAAGDRIIEPTTLERLFDLFYSGQCDLALIATPGPADSSQARIVETADQVPLSIVEAADIRQRQVFAELGARAGRGPLDAGAASRIISGGYARRGVPASEAKLSAAFGPLWEAAQRGGAGPVDWPALIPEPLTCFEFALPDGRRWRQSPGQVQQLKWMNNSVYVIKASALRHALGRLNRENAQREEYLSAIVEVLAQEPGRFRVRTLRVENPEYVLGYNDPAELLEVESILRARKQGQQVRQLEESASFRSLAAWRGLFDSAASPGGDATTMWRAIAAIYGEDTDVISERIEAYQNLLTHAVSLLDEASRVLIVRSSGRLNVMGRHIDHQGGNCNLMTIGFESLLAVHPREDDRVRLFNTDAANYPHREFSIGDLVAELPWDDWLSLVNSDKVTEMVRTTGGDWSQYVKAALLRLQKKFPHHRLRGMDIVVSGNIPPAAGLSSSSSLVVASAESTIAVNQLDVFPAQFVDLCGEGEWFVGTRGGSADHAAVKMGRRGKVIQVGFFDFALKQEMDFLADYVMVVGNSGISARKSGSARDQFNHRIACYRLGLRLIRRSHPQFAPLLQHLRDVNVRTLRIPLSWIYRILLHLPDQATRQELDELLAGEDLSSLFATHQPPEDGRYPIRGVVLYGLAECERARAYAEDIKAGRMDDIGRMMRVSHDGDRVVRWNGNGQSTPYSAPTSNSYLLDLMADLESGEPDRVERAQLRWQPGRYCCSLPAIDRMVDIANATEGVAGAQLAGAGLGGCMMVLVKKEAVPTLRENLTRDHFELDGLSPAILVCRPIAGSGLLCVEDG